MHGNRPSPPRAEWGVLVDLDPPSAGVLVAFGGIWGGLGAFPIFEFRRTLSSVGCKCVYLLDHHQAWYHRGVTGIGPDVDTVADWLRRLSAEHGRIVTIGNSAGGYAALLFAALTGCEAHAFSPQTFIDAELRRECGDGRWQEELSALEESGKLDRRYADLLPVLAAGQGRFHVYYGRDDALDVHHAERLRGVEGMTIHAHDGSGHNVVRELRDSGRLRELAEGLAR